MAASDPLETCFPPRGAEEVGDDEHERATTQRAHPRVEELGERGQRSALEPRSSLELVQDAQDLDPAATGGNRPLDARPVDRRADAVAVTREEPRQYRREVEDEIALATVHRPEVDRGRKVEEELSADLAVLEVLAHVRRVEPCRDVPVDVPHVVAEDVLADVREVEAVSFEDRAVVALQQTVEPADDGPLEPLQAALSSGGRHVPATVRSARGCA